MKFAGVLKSVAVASALVASSASFAADYSFVDGSTSLTLSQDIQGVYDTIAVATQLLAGSTSTITNGGTGDQGYPIQTVSQNTTSVVMAADGVTLISGSSAGSGVEELRTSTGKTVQIANFVLSNADQALYADITSNGVTYAHSKFLVFGADTQIIGDPIHVSSTVGADGFYHAKGTVTNLILDGTYNSKTKVATGALALLANGLGVTGVSVGAAYNVWIGDLQIDNRFSAPAAQVPEPSTYAMLLAGVAGVGFMARRRKAA